MALSFQPYPIIHKAGAFAIELSPDSKHSLELELMTEDVGIHPAAPLRKWESRLGGHVGVTVKRYFPVLAPTPGMVFGPYIGAKAGRSNENGRWFGGLPLGFRLPYAKMLESALLPYLDLRIETQFAVADDTALRGNFQVALGLLF